MAHETVMVIDCGSTNITVIAFDHTGTVLASSSRPNNPTPQPGGEGWMIWDMEGIWGKICEAAQEVTASIDTDTLRAVTVTTFGADGTFLDRTGNEAYPVISWQCTRTELTMAEVAELMSPREIYDITGYNLIRFNTLLRFLWLRKHAPEVFDRAEHWLMAPGLISHRLTGDRSLDATSAGTMMALDLAQRTWSEKMLGFADMDASWFPRWVEPGEVIGGVTAVAAQATGIPVGIPVTAAGHDTQFALFGSGASGHEAVVSSGTWEILLARTDRYTPNDAGFENGLITECDCLPGMWNPQLLMMGSGALEWVRRQFFATDDGPDIYDRMIGEAQEVNPAANQVYMHPTFVPGTGPLQKYGVPASIVGITATTTRGDIYRAALEGLCCQLRAGLDVIRQSTGFEPSGIRVVGGGAKNRLWNQLRADITGLPVTITSQSEITALGAALFAFAGVGVFSGIDEALTAIDFSSRTIEPGTDREVYERKYEQFLRIPAALSGAYE